ncbi:MAG: ABC transporter ATP-binding protein [Bacteroidota bacterium]
MIEIRLENLSKRFNHEVIFKELDYHFKSKHVYAITGPNGSGKSTLLKIITGFTLPSKGSLVYVMDSKIVEPDNIYQHISIATPYMELIKSLTLSELVNYHSKFKAFRDSLSVDEVIQRMELDHARHKLVKNFSSGMSQRLRLGLAFFSNALVTFLDEPTTNLDEKGCEWYQNQLKDISNRLVFIASNQPEEYQLTDEILQLNKFK